MKIIPIVTLLILFGLFTLSAKGQEITVFPGFWSVEYYQDDQRIDKPELKKLMSQNEEVSAYWKKSNTNSTIAYVAIAGELGCAFWMGTQFGEDDPNKILAPAAGTVGFAIIAGIFINSANKNGKKAILKYNTQFDNKTTFRLVPTTNQNGLGLALKF